jgi:hypothetical protein
MRGLSTGTLASVAAILMIAAPTHGSCPGVTHVNLTESSWEIDSFYDSATGEPLTVELSISNIGRDTQVYYFDGSWHPVTADVTVQGSKTKFNSGGAVTIRYLFQGCGDEVQPIGD